MTDDATKEPVVLTEAELAQLRALCDAALHRPDPKAGFAMHPAEAELLAAARMLLPRLLDAYAELRADNAELLAAADADGSVLTQMQRDRRRDLDTIARHEKFMNEQGKRLARYEPVIAAAREWAAVNGWWGEARAIDNLEKAIDALDAREGEP